MQKPVRQRGRIEQRQAGSHAECGCTTRATSERSDRSSLERGSIDLERALDVERPRVECPGQLLRRPRRQVPPGRRSFDAAVGESQSQARQLRRDPRDGRETSRQRPHLALVVVASSGVRHIDPIRLRRSSGRRGEGGSRVRGRAGRRSARSAEPRTHAPRRASNVRPPGRRNARPAASPRAPRHRPDAAGRARTPSLSSRQARCENVSDIGVRRTVTAVSTAWAMASNPAIAVTWCGLVKVSSGSSSAIRAAAEGSPHATFMCVAASATTV